MIMYPPPFAIFNDTMTDSSDSSSIIFSVLLGTALSLIAFITALGNIIVLLAFHCDKKLRTINDYFILNMAIADFLVGFFCIPFYIPFSLTQSWPFGRLFCKIWVTIDDVATMASVINIVAISINRYWSIAYPIIYRKYVKQHFVYIVMACIWCLSFLNFAPGIWLINFSPIETNVTRTDCSGDYNNSFMYMLIAQFNYFIWPFVVLCVLNMLIMLNIWKRSRKMSRLICLRQYQKAKGDVHTSSFFGTSKEVEDENHLPNIPKFQVKSTESCPSLMITENPSMIRMPSSNPKKKRLSDNHMTIVQHRLSRINSSQIHSSVNNDLEECHQISIPIHSLRRSISIVNSTSRHYPDESVIECDFDTSRVNLQDINTIRRSRPKLSGYYQKRFRIIRDRKAARSLFILVIVFLIFLFPYVICATASTAGIKISTLIFEISFWLLWMNSTCNPFLYPFIQIKYRKAYLKLFQSCRQSFSYSQTIQSI
ncbi:hypothetical protein I4U23_015872 [Adineta vaga]|nr:hypothetical protein I4U23_015872 [Adineta vaga]